MKLDLEGVSGVVSYDQCHPGRPEYEFGRRMVMGDLCAVLAGAFAGGCDELVIYDPHCTGRNVELSELDERVLAICGKPTFHGEFCLGLDGTFDAQFLLGSHAMRGTPGGLLAHTYEEDVSGIAINETRVGETGLEAGLAGEFGLPTAFISADSAGAAEAVGLLGNGPEIVVVKEAVCEHGGVCLPPRRTHRMLSEAAERAVRRIPEMTPFVFEAPVSLEVTFNNAESAATIENAPSVERVSERAVLIKAESLLSAYKSYILAREGRG